MKHLALTVLVLVATSCAPPRPAPDEHPGSVDEAITQCPGRDKLRGIDVSYYQGRIDWPRVSASGVSFAFARVADGATFVDPAFADNWPAMKAARVIRGSYQFFRPAQDPVAQAAVFLREIEARGGLRPGDLPPALDIEVTDGVPAATLRARAQVWLAHVEAATGRTPIIYTSPGFWQDLEAGASFGRYTLWLAHWETACPTLPGSWERWRFWQDTAGRAVPGIADAVDTDWFDGTRAELEALAAAPGGERPRVSEPRPAPRAKASSRPRGRGRKRHGPRRVDLGRLFRVLSI
jgi:lysozyme